ncbi:MAG: sigma-70 family RNA polymerase sigma factor [Acidimicrobiales bacterium]
MAIQPEALDAYDEDRALVAAFQAGEVAAFGRIVRAHYPALLARARRRLGTGGDAEDAVQEALLRAFLALDRFGGEFNLNAWLNRILANVCADAAERRTSELRMRDRLSAWREEVLPAGDEGSDAELHGIIKEAIASLPESYRVAFVLREVEEKPYAEVAATMAVTEENARARVHRARSSLARALREVGATLGAFAIPLRLAAERPLLARWLSSRRVPIGTRNAAEPHGLANPARAAQVIGHSQILSAPLRSVLAPDVVTDPSTPIASLSSLTTTPIAQALAQAATNPVAQSMLGAGAEVGRSALPMAGAALATLAAGAAAVMPAAATLPKVAAPVPAVAAAPASTSGSALVSYAQPTGGPSAKSPSSATGTVGSAPASQASTTSPPTSGNSTSATSKNSASAPASPGGTDLWSWVGDATSTSRSAPSTTSGSTSSTGASPEGSALGADSPPNGAAAADPSTQSGAAATGQAQSSTQSTANQAGGQTQGATSNAGAHCPWTQSFPLLAPGPITLPPPEPAGVNETGAFATGQIPLPDNTSIFGAGGIGSATNGKSSGVVEASLGACLGGTNAPIVVANLASLSPNVTSPPIFQIRAAMVVSSVSTQETYTLFRGTGVWLTGPDRGSAPVPLVADIITRPVQGAGANDQPADSGETVMLLVAFFGPISNLVAPGSETTPGAPSTVPTDNMAGGDATSSDVSTSSTSSDPSSSSSSSEPSTASGSNGPTSTSASPSDEVDSTSASPAGSPSASDQTGSPGTGTTSSTTTGTPNSS